MDSSSDLPVPGSAFDSLGRLAKSSTRRPAQTHDIRPSRSHRTIFISDTHLGTRGCKAEALADFLAHNECETLFLVGDIVDGWQLKRRWIWPEASPPAAPSVSAAASVWRPPMRPIWPCSFNS